MIRSRLALCACQPVLCRRGASSDAATPCTPASTAAPARSSTDISHKSHSSSSNISLPRASKTTAPANAISPSASACRATPALSNWANSSSATVSERTDGRSLRARSQARRHGGHGQRRRRQGRTAAPIARDAPVYHRLQGKARHRAGRSRRRYARIRNRDAHRHSLAPGEFWFQHNFLRARSCSTNGWKSTFPKLAK